MNVLAHLLLADLTGHCPVATLQADFVKGRLEGKHQGAELAALRLHRRVDAFTDQHPVTARCRGLLEPEFRRYAGILLDMFFDYFLVRHWSEYCPQPLPAFANHQYRLLQANAERFPERPRQFVAFLVQANLLCNYGDIELISAVLERIGRRLRRPNPLHAAGGQLRQHHGELNAGFLEFFPQLIAFARQYQAAE